MSYINIANFRKREIEQTAKRGFTEHEQRVWNETQGKFKATLDGNIEVDVTEAPSLKPDAVVPGGTIFHI